MLSSMPLLSAYWPYLVTFVLVYIIYVMIFGSNRSDSTKNTESEAIKLKAKQEAKRPADESTVNKDDDGDEEEDEVSPLTFPEDTPHIPYKFTEISEVRF